MSILGWFWDCHCMHVQSTCGCEADVAGLREALAAAASGGGGGGAGGSSQDAAKSARTEALQPGGDVTRRFLARNPTVLQVQAACRGMTGREGGAAGLVLAAVLGRAEGIPASRWLPACLAS